MRRRKTPSQTDMEVAQELCAGSTSTSMDTGAGAPHDEPRRAEKRQTTGRCGVEAEAEDEDADAYFALYY